MDFSQRAIEWGIELAKRPSGVALLHGTYRHHSPFCHQFFTVETEGMKLYPPSSMDVAILQSVETEAASLFPV
jgi:hypothetical protein